MPTSMSPFSGCCENAIPLRHACKVTIPYLQHSNPQGGLRGLAVHGLVLWCGGAVNLNGPPPFCLWTADDWNWPHYHTPRHPYPPPPIPHARIPLLLRLHARLPHRWKD